MTKEIIIDGKAYRFKSSAAIPRMYRLKFNRDIFVDMTELEKSIKEHEKQQKAEREKAEKEGIPYEESSTLPISSLEMFENIAYLMNKHGDPGQPEDINDWLDQFDTFCIYEILPEILELWNLNNKRMSVPRK